MKNTNKMPFGYKENGAIDFLQSEVIKSVYDIVDRYCGKVTIRELDAIIEEHKEMYGEELTMEQARKNLTVEMTKRVINEELDRKWQEYISAKKGVAVSGSGE